LLSLGVDAWTSDSLWQVAVYLMTSFLFELAVWPDCAYVDSTNIFVVSFLIDPDWIGE